ncbi:hypothetical protein ADUPG1_009027 [Aduncisulcus paluster]|uniref:Protein kinase domain-containing protein n=1 Tax=Aduncisulcus paluster TaxID=2918883 RepID=A0ABQ5KU31_9EUKA|nr:hypothetical protein ADUPG1_009027 [Aduncisulcus paluster]
MEKENVISKSSSLESEETTSSETKYIKEKHNSNILTSASNIIPLCIFGSGGFGDVILVKLAGIPFPYCMLKIMRNIRDERVLQNCRTEFNYQQKLFMNPKCFNRIPRPLYILDLLDENFCGIYGFLMEYCQGGSVKDFSRSWCMRETDEEDSETTDSEDSKFEELSRHPDPLDLNPVRVSSLCIGMIECLDDVFTAKPRLIHRDIKPDNFLVRFNPDSRSEKCSIILGDLGLAEIRSSISSSFLGGSSAGSSSSSKPHDETKITARKKSIIGTLVYNSYEALEGRQSQKSDAYSLGMSIQALFEGINPLFNMPCLQFLEPCEYVKGLKEVISNGTAPKLSGSCLFQSLKTIDGGKYKAVYSCLNEVFEGLTKLKIDDRMSVHDARMKVQSVKSLLPRIGQGWKCPRIEDIISSKLKENPSLPSELKAEVSLIPDLKLDHKWDEGLSQISSTISCSNEKNGVCEGKNESEEGKIYKSEGKDKEEEEEEEECKKEISLDDVNRAIQKCDYLWAYICACRNEEEKSKLYYQNRDAIETIFVAFLSPRWEGKLKTEVIQCCKCLSYFLEYTHEKTPVFLSITDINDLFDTFFDHILQIEEMLGNDVFQEFCEICSGYTFQIHDKLDSFFPKITPAFQRIFDWGSKEELSGDVAFSMVMTLRNISFHCSSSTGQSLLTLIKPCFSQWFKSYSTISWWKGTWMTILVNITWLFDENIPIKEICSDAWALYEPVLDVTREEFVGGRIIEEKNENVMFFFSNLCSDSSHIIEIHRGIGDLLDGWFRAIKKEHHHRGSIFWAQLLSNFSTIPSLVPKLSPKYDNNMEWCMNYGGYLYSCSRYFSHTHPDLKKWDNIIETIRQSANEESKSKIYRKYYDSINAVFVSIPFQTKKQIKQNRKEIILCCFCLEMFVLHNYANNEISLPIPDLNHLIETFFEHLSNLIKLEDDIHSIFIRICVNYTHLVADKRYVIFPKLASSLQHFLDMGKRGKLVGELPNMVSILLFNISHCPLLPTMTTLLSLIKPYLKRWLKSFPHYKISGRWMVILKNITWSYEDNAPNSITCEEAFSLFPCVFEFVTHQEDDFIAENDNEYFLLFMANLCCVSSNAQKIFLKIDSFLEGWFDKLKHQKQKLGIPMWGKLVSMLSTIPELVSSLSPRFDGQMEWCQAHSDLTSVSLEGERLKYLLKTPDEGKGSIFDEDYARYLKNCK